MFELNHIRIVVVVGNSWTNQFLSQHLGPGSGAVRVEVCAKDLRSYLGKRLKLSQKLFRRHVDYRHWRFNRSNNSSTSIQQQQLFRISCSIILTSLIGVCRYFFIFFVLGRVINICFIMYIYARVILSAKKISRAVFFFFFFWFF